MSATDTFLNGRLPCTSLEHDLIGHLRRVEQEKSQLQQTLDDLCCGNRVILPKSDDHARAMLLVATNTLKL